MAWTLDSSASTTVVVGTENTVAAGSTTNATYVFHVRLNNMAAGDIVELRVYTKTLTGGTLELLWKSTYGPQLPLALTVQSPPIASDISVSCSIKQTAGTARAFDWKLLRM